MAHAPKTVSVERLADGLVFPEGPAVLEDGSVAFVEVNRSQVSIWEQKHGVRRLADTGGGPNSCCLGSDDCLYVAQNRGLVGNWRADRVQPGCIQRVSMDGQVEILITEVDGLELRQPNDLAWGPDGSLYFTDPGFFDLDTRPDAGRLFVVRPGGSGELLAELENTYPNGIAVDADGSIVWTESYPRRVCRRRTNGAIEELPPIERSESVPDGMAISADGTLLVAVLFAGGIQVLGPDGDDRGVVDVGAVNSNCTFAGTALYITDFGMDPMGGEIKPAGVLWRVELGQPGVEVFRGQL